MVEETKLLGRMGGGSI